MRHVEDALALLPVVEAALPQPSAALRLVDVGSGAGFPGMVLAIARPKWHVTLVESLGKRTRFLEQVAERASVSNVRTLWARAEDVGRDASMREQSDVVVARAVAELRCEKTRFFCPHRHKSSDCVDSWLQGFGGAVPSACTCRWCVDCSEERCTRARGAKHTPTSSKKHAGCKRCAYVCSNAQVADARRAVAVLGGGALSVVRVATLGPDGLPFTAITCRKERPCDALYPREAGTPKRQPL